MLLKSRKIWFTSVLAWRDEQQQQHPIPETEISKALSINTVNNLMSAHSLISVFEIIAPF